MELSASIIFENILSQKRQFDQTRNIPKREHVNQQVFSELMKWQNNIIPLELRNLRQSLRTL